MLVPDFIKRMLGFVSNAEKSLETLANQLADALAKSALLETKAKGLETDVAARDASIKDLNTKLDVANTTITAKDGEITKLKADVVAEKKRANEVLASQGILAEDLPAAEVGADVPGKKSETAWEKYSRLSAENPREAGAFYGAHAQEILDTRPKN